MLLSKQKKFIFFRLPRTGSTAMTEVLTPYADIVGEHGEGVTAEFPYSMHMSPLALKEMIGAEEFDKYFKFCFVRNPMDRAISLYYHRRTRYVRNASSFKRSIYGFIFAFNHRFSFLLFTIFVLNPKRGLTRSIYNFISDKNGDLLVDKIYRFESLNESYKDILATVGIEDPTSTKVHKTNHSNKAVPDREIQTSLSKWIVKKKYKKSIDNFYSDKQ